MSRKIYSLSQSIKKGVVTAFYAAIAYIATGDLHIESMENVAEQIGALIGVIIVRTVHDYVKQRYSATQ